MSRSVPVCPENHVERGTPKGYTYTWSKDQTEKIRVNTYAEIATILNTLKQFLAVSELAYLVRRRLMVFADKPGASFR